MKLKLSLNGSENISPHTRTALQSKPSRLLEITQEKSKHKGKLKENSISQSKTPKVSVDKRIFIPKTLFKTHTYDIDSSLEAFSSYQTGDSDSSSVHTETMDQFHEASVPLVLPCITSDV